MNITFLGQGFHPSSDAQVGEHLMKFLSGEDFHSFIGFSAFASEAGIIGLSDYFQKAKNHFKSLTLVVGVDQKGTSKEALNAILALDISSYVFYQPSFPIFHPKIYLFEGEKRTELIIGSSNLTTQGLFVNVEASLLVSINNEKQDDQKVVEDLKDYFRGIFELNDPNLQPLSKELIEELEAQKILPNEKERQKQHDKFDQVEKEKTLFARLFPKRTIGKISKEFRRARKAVKLEAVAEAEEIKPKMPSPLGALVWTKRDLPKSDVQIPAREGTNPTGGIRLTQADFLVDGKAIDQTTYFRKLFGDFKWKVANRVPFVEVVIVPFEITIKDIFIGKFNLEVRHKPSGEAGQHNYTTSISWGKVGNEIRDAYLVGADLKLFKSANPDGPFQIIFS